MGQSHIYLSDDRHHDTTYVKDNNEHLLPLLQQQRADMHMQPIKHVTYLSDGGPAHYKNARSFYNMTHVPNDLAPQPRGSTEPLKADWIFLGPNHGKNNWDGVTGIFKNKCRRACLNKRTVLESAQALVNFGNKRKRIKAEGEEKVPYKKGKNSHYTFEIEGHHFTDTKDLELARSTEKDVSSVPGTPSVRDCPLLQTVVTVPVQAAAAETQPQR
jgi:hypothetical protein